MFTLDLCAAKCFFRSLDLGHPVRQALLAWHAVLMPHSSAVWALSGFIKFEPDEMAAACGNRHICFMCDCIFFSSYHYYIVLYRIGIGSALYSNALIPVLLKSSSA